MSILSLCESYSKSSYKEESDSLIENLEERNMKEEDDTPKTVVSNQPITLRSLSRKGISLKDLVQRTPLESEAVRR